MLQGELNEQQRSFERLVNPEIFSDQNTITRNKKMRQLQEFWSSIEQHHADYQETRASMNDIVNGRSDRARLDMDELQYKNRKRYIGFYTNIHLASVNLNAFKFDPANGSNQMKLDLGALIDTWNSQLHSVQKNLETIPTERFANSELLPFLDQHSRSQSQYLHEIHSFSGQINELVQDIETRLQNHRTTTPKQQTPRSKMPFHLHEPTPIRKIKLDQPNDTITETNTPNRNMLDQTVNAVHDALTPSSEIARIMRQQAKQNTAVRRVELIHDAPMKEESSKQGSTQRFVSNDMLLFGDEVEIEKEIQKQMRQQEHAIRKQQQEPTPQPPQQQQQPKIQEIVLEHVQQYQQKRSSPLRERRLSAQIREKRAEDMAKQMSGVIFTPPSGDRKQTVPIEEDDENKENIDLNNMSTTSDHLEPTTADAIMFSPNHREIDVLSSRDTPTLASKIIVSAFTPITPSRSVNLSGFSDFDRYPFDDSYDGYASSDDEDTKKEQLNMLISDVKEMKQPRTPHHERLEREMEKLKSQDLLSQMDFDVSFEEFDFSSGHYPRKSIVDQQLLSQLRDVREEDYLIDVQDGGTLTPDEKMHYRRQSNTDRALSRLSMGPPKSTRKVNANRRDTLSVKDITNTPSQERPT
jgi:hypothetical protein